MAASMTQNIARNLQQVKHQITKSGGSDSKFFTTNKKGENHELRQELADPRKEKKRDAVKKVIANMTVGKDVSMLFTDVINCMQTGSIELKKLVYLYLINYAKSNPDLAILAVNTFVKDANDPNPLIRALSVRTMGCIRVDRITEYLCEPLRSALRDDDPYVRKTAAICVAKLYDINQELVEEQGFLDTLRDLLSDANPTVVSNAVAALSEIAETGGREVFKITTSVLQKLLAALNECTEWGQVFILDCLAGYTPKDTREAEGIIERVTPRLQHANSAVVLSAIKVIMRYLEKVENEETVRTLSRKLAPPLVTLLSAEPEIQYVALRNINIIVQKRPTVLQNEIKVFFCKYNDPIYVKMEKLEIIIRLVSERNVEQVLLELKEYATEVDVDFVRKSVRAIGRCAIKLERAAEKCINVLLELIQTKVNYVVQEAITVIKDIFRKYPNRYESIIATLCENLESLDEPEAKASMVWIIGEYAERIDNADELLETFMDGFHDETATVQLQLLTATVKLFLKRPADTQEMVQKVLNMATEDSDNPDLRDRGYVYWRLLSTNPETAKAVVLGEKPTIEDDTGAIEPTLLDTLVANIATLASVYHKPAESFVVKASGVAGDKKSQSDEEESDGEAEEGSDEEEDTPKASSSSEPIDLLDMGGLSVSPTPTGPPAGGSSGNILDDLLGGPISAGPAAGGKAKPVVLTADKGQGVQIAAAFVRKNGQIFLCVDVQNQSPAPLPGIAVQFNKSTFGITPVQPQIMFPSPISSGSRASGELPISATPGMVNTAVAPNLDVQTAVKLLGSGAVVYFTVKLDLEAIFLEDGQLEKGDFLTKWKGIEDAKQSNNIVKELPSENIDVVSGKLRQGNLFFIARRQIAEGLEAAYYSFKTATGVVGLVEITFKAGTSTCKVGVKTEQPAFAGVFQATLERLLKSP